MLRSDTTLRLLQRIRTFRSCGQSHNPSISHHTTDVSCCKPSNHKTKHRDQLRYKAESNSEAYRWVHEILNSSENCDDTVHYPDACKGKGQEDCIEKLRFCQLCEEIRSSNLLLIHLHSPEHLSLRWKGSKETIAQATMRTHVNSRVPIPNLTRSRFVDETGPPLNAEVAAATIAIPWATSRCNTKTLRRSRRRLDLGFRYLRLLRVHFSARSK